MESGSLKFRTNVSVLLALLVPAYFGVLPLVSAIRIPAESLIVPIVLFFSFLALCAYFVSGFRWAIWVAAVCSLAFAVFQIYFVGGHLVANASSVEVRQVLWVLLSVLVAANAGLIVGSKRLRALHESRRAELSAQQLTMLKVLRWSLVVVVAIALAMDLARMFA
jgi:hypothetical protein